MRWEPVSCICGSSRRIFASLGQRSATRGNFGAALWAGAGSRSLLDGIVLVMIGDFVTAYPYGGESTVTIAAV